MQLREDQFAFLKGFLVRYKPLIRLGSDADAILEHLEKRETVAVIPAKKNRKCPRKHDEEKKAGPIKW